MCLACTILVFGSSGLADVFNMPTGLTSLETVSVGNVGNVADSTGYGAVDYSYNIGKYEVTAGQYIDFLNAVAKTDTYGLYYFVMDNFGGCQITQHGTSGNYAYDFSGRPIGTEDEWANRPVNIVSWGDAARFANWLHNGQPAGAQDLTTTEDGAYYLNGMTSDSGLTAVSREADARWAIPTEDEWYKAAYHKNDGVTGNYFDYPTGSDSTPSNDLVNPTDPGNNATFYIWDDADYTIGSPYYTTEVGAHENSESPYGTFDQAGNVMEWNGAVTGSNDALRGMRGGSGLYGDVDSLQASSRYFTGPGFGYANLGFRLVQIPEPASMSLLALGALAIIRRRRK